MCTLISFSVALDRICASSFFDNRGVWVSLRAPWLILGPISSPTCEFPLKAMVGYMRGFGFETLRREQTSNSQALTSNLCFWRLWWSTALIFLLIFGIFHRCYSWFMCSWQPWAWLRGWSEGRMGPRDCPTVVSNFCYNYSSFYRENIRSYTLKMLFAEQFDIMYMNRNCCGIVLQLILVKLIVFH